MSEEKVKEEIILFLESKLKEEYDKRHCYNNVIYQYALEGMETDPDAMSEIMTKTLAYDASNSLTHSYRDIISFINNMDK